MIPFLIFAALILQSNADFNYNIEDIPIEAFEPRDLQEHDMDLEMLPRIQRSFSNIPEDDPKENFFRYMRSFNGNFHDYAVQEPSAQYRYLPKPGGFYNSRKKRSTDQVKVKPDKAIEKKLGKPLELAILDSLNVTTVTEETPTSTTGKLQENDKSYVHNNILINDFIRFKRDNSNKKSEAESIKRQIINNDDSHSEKMLMDPNNLPTQDNAREPRGATKEEWVKQEYPVRRNSDIYVDNLPSSSETIRAPRVHFVTQRRMENIHLPEYRSFDREPRARNLQKDLSRDSPRDILREIPYNYQPRITRHYNPMPSSHSGPQNYYKSDNYYRYNTPRDLYDRGQDNYYLERDRNLYSGNKQKRIIYYATLPDISRTPPNVDLRDRYDYRDRYEDRYVNSPSSSDPYRFRKVYPKSRYNDNDRMKAPYPMKVSTDVNVREIKKNPEGRIYSEVDRNRYAYNKAPYLSTRN